MNSNAHVPCCARFVLFLVILVCLLSVTALASRGGSEYNGQFEPALVPNADDFEKVVFGYTMGGNIKGQLTITAGAHLAVAKLIDPQTQENSIPALLVEEQGTDPVIFVDTNRDNTLTSEEKYPLKQQEKDDPYLWTASAELKLNGAPFKTFPIVLTYFRTVRVGKMGPEDRLVTQTTEAIACGRVDVHGRKVLVGYSYNIERKNVDPLNGVLGVDMDDDGKIDLDNLSPESTKADDEAVVFRVGDTYFSTSKADAAKNQIVLREREAKDYKRLELYTGKDFPDFAFTDFDGKKHKFSELKGKYILLDIWGFWCPACRDELPYIREANRRFQTRNFAVMGLNTDANSSVESVKKAMLDVGMTWTQAQLPSVIEFIGHGLRVSSFPTTFLISPEGKLISMSRRSHRDEKSLRGKELLETLDEILPKH